MAEEYFSCIAPILSIGWGEGINQEEASCAFRA